MNETLPPENASPASAAPMEPVPASEPPLAEAIATAPAEAGAVPDEAHAVEPDTAPSADAVAEPVAEPAAAAEASPAGEPAPAVADLSPAATAQRLAELFPALFGPEPKPIKLRIQADIQQRVPGVFSRRSLSLFLHRHTTSTPYLKALASLPARFDLDGQPAGEVAAEHKAAAEAEVARRRQLAAERRAAEREKALAARREAEQQARREQNKQQRAEQKERRQPWQQKQAEALAADIAREQERAQGEAQTQAQRDRAALLRAYETSTLTRANFLVLKRMTSEQLDEQLALARTEAASRGPRGPAPTRPQPAAFNEARKPPGSRSPA